MNELMAIAGVDVVGPFPENLSALYVLRRRSFAISNQPSRLGASSTT